MGGLEEAVVAGGDELELGGIWEEVSGELFAGELIEGEVFVERADDVIAVRGDVVILIAVVTNGVGIADEVEPVDGHAFAVAGRGEKEIDFGFDCGLRVVLESGQEAIAGFGCGWKAGEVEVKAPNQGDGIGIRRRRNGFLLESPQNEAVDPIDRPILTLNDGGGVLEGGLVSPRLVIPGTFGDPLPEKCEFLIGDLFVGLRWWHDFFWVQIQDAGDNFRFIRFARLDGDFKFASLGRPFKGVEPQICFAVFFIGTMAMKALV